MITSSCYEANSSNLANEHLLFGFKLNYVVVELLYEALEKEIGYLKKGIVKSFAKLRSFLVE